MIRIENGDALQLIDTVKESSVDLLLTDPPYNVSRPNNFQSLGTASRIGMDFGEWDKSFDVTSWIKKAPRVLKENASVVVFCDWKKISEIVDAFEKNCISPKRCLVLSKSNPAPFNRDRMFVNDVEFAVWGVYNSKRKPTKWIFNREDSLEKCIFRTKVQSSKLHPTMKDINVIGKLIRVLSNENDTVLDLFMGSGTTGVAAKELKRNFVGFEIDEKFFNIAEARIKYICKENKDKIEKGR